MAQKSAIENDHLKKARALADECNRTLFCDEGRSKLSSALKIIDTELSAVEAQRDELHARLDALIRAINNTHLVGRCCLSEDDCINSKIDFSAYERGVLDAVNAMQTHWAANAMNKAKGGAE